MASRVLRVIEASSIVVRCLTLPALILPNCCTASALRSDVNDIVASMLGSVSSLRASCVSPLIICGYFRANFQLSPQDIIYDNIKRFDEGSLILSLSVMFYGLWPRESSVKLRRLKRRKRHVRALRSSYIVDAYRE